MTNEGVLDKVEYLTNKLEKNKIKAQKNKKVLSKKSNELYTELRIEEKIQKSLKHKKNLFLDGYIGVFYAGILVGSAFLIGFQTFWGILSGVVLSCGTLGCLIAGGIYTHKLKKIEKKIKLINDEIEKVKNLSELEDEKLAKIMQRREKLYNRLERELKKTNKRVKENAPIRMKNNIKNRKFDNEEYTN